MTAKVTVTEAQRTQAYRQAIGNYAARASQTAPTARQMAASQSRQIQPQQDHGPRAIKHELLSMLHARSNSGTVRLGDVSRAFDALVRDSRLSDR
jgi:hypothetical protein